MSNLSLATLLCLGWAAVTMANPAGRIVGGKAAAVGQFPHQVSLRYNGQHICGGTIISRRYILTAAHCVGDDDANGIYQLYNPQRFTIRAGSNNRRSGGVIAQVEKITAHEKYGDFLNDVAIIQLKTLLIFSDNLKAIPLASAEVPVGAQVIISGWGDMKTNGDSPIMLLYNTLEAISKFKCFTSIGMFTDTLICLAHQSENGACQGDSGGPAIYNGELVGVAGFVVGGCGSANPDGYAKVSYHVDWIKLHADL